MKKQIFKGIIVFLGIIIISPVQVKALTIDERIQSLFNQVKILQERLNKIESGLQKAVNIEVVPIVSQGNIEDSISTSTIITDTEVIFSTTTIKNGIESTVSKSNPIIDTCSKKVIIPGDNFKPVWSVIDTCGKKGG